MTFLPSLFFYAGIFINGVQVDGLKDVEFKDVSVRFDSHGNVLVDAPGYNIQVVGEPVRYSPQTARSSANTATSIPATAPSSNTGPVDLGSWWLATEDEGTRGHTIEVSINGRAVATVRSGEDQRIVDISQYLQHGPNQVSLASTTSGAEGGSLFVYLGSGSNVSGTVVLDAPDVQFSVNARSNPSDQRAFTLTVP